LKNRFLTILEYEIIHFLKNMHKPKIIWAGCCNFYKIPKSRKKNYFSNQLNTEIIFKAL
jgi:hypothetical protein